MKKMKMLALAAAAQFLPLIALAQPVYSTQPVYLDKNRIVNLLQTLLTWFASILVIVGIFMILWAAFRYMTAGGDDTKVEKAKKTLIWGLVGIGIAILAFGVWNFVGSFLSGV